jgi:ATP-dependent helicase/nuclease subunit A
VRGELQERFTHFFVDEFQDTDPLQVEILLLLAAGDRGQSDWRQVDPVPGKLFVVGDPKQSIYRFRRADVALYEEAKRLLLARGARLMRLTASFRARPSIQAIVNSAFDPAMRGSEDGSQASYVPLEKVRDEREGQPTVVVLPVPRPYGNFGTIVNWAVEESSTGSSGRVDGRWRNQESRHRRCRLRTGTSASCYGASSPGART